MFYQVDCSTRVIVLPATRLCSTNSIKAAQHAFLSLILTTKLASQADNSGQVSTAAQLSFQTSTSQKTQPCDVGPFWLLKAVYRHDAKQLIRGESNMIGK